MKSLYSIADLQICELNVRVATGLNKKWYYFKTTCDNI